VIAGLLAAVALAVCYPPPVQAPISVPFAQPACSFCPGHRGLEYQLSPGTPVQIVAPGVVTFAGMVAGIRYVVVLQTDGMRATYGMLQTATVSRGEAVVAGQVAGYGSQRLYFGLRDAADHPVDPTLLVGRLVGRARLLPANGDAQRRAPPPRLTCTATGSMVLPV